MGRCGAICRARTVSGFGDRLFLVRVTRRLAGATTGSGGYVPSREPVALSATAVVCIGASISLGIWANKSARDGAPAPCPLVGRLGTARPRSGLRQDSLVLGEVP